MMSVLIIAARAGDLRHRDGRRSHVPKNAVLHRTSAGSRVPEARRLPPALRIAPLESDLLEQQRERLLDGVVLHDDGHQGIVLDRALFRGAEWDRADSYADQLEQTFAAEPLPRVNTCVERARVPAALGRGVCTSDMRSALERIQADIGRMDMNLYAASVERALSELPV